MSKPEPILPPQYEPQTTEAKWREFWQKKEIFKANPHKEAEPYAIVIPPPNVTGSLHMGHAFEQALIDTLIRFHRMKGKNTLCLPGTDHASIAVQTIVEKQLKEEGLTRDDLGREKFLERAWQWRVESGDKIVNQLKRLGLSADWSRERFTLDEELSVAVKTAFIKLYEEGLIYRGNYMVNWCPASRSAVSDLEVEKKEVEGKLWHLRYLISGEEGYVEVATTRPETMLGDTAVAVNPNDERYQHLIGKKAILPIALREIPIIGDEFVDPSFGTGCVKVTPAHDPNDFAMGKRHDLPMVNILNKDGSLNENGARFAGQDRFVARENIIAALKEEGLLGEIETYTHTVPYSDRGKVPVEPLLSTQWFVKIRPLAEDALRELDEHNNPDYVPEKWRKVYRDWLVKLEDWCISRQLWWGHQIPAWYVVSRTDGEIKDNTPFVVAFDEEQALAKAKEQYGEESEIVRDADVLDTWFSSGLWPFSTMGWPKSTADLATYYPNTTMVTGFDIIFFWVARMTMMSKHFTGQIPFKDVYIHGLVRDENGKKMSKSAGNGIDPLLLCDRYGTDALRYTLIREVAGAGQDISLQLNRVLYETILNPELETNPTPEFLQKYRLKNKKQLQEELKIPLSESVEASRNFANKLWNAARFVLMNLDGKTPAQLGYPDLQQLELSDRWILSRFYQIVEDTNNYLATYSLGEAAKAIYEFIWGDFCDWYIELVKTRLRQDKTSTSRLIAQQILAYVLEGILKLLHPFMPHITEEIWHTLTQNADDSLALQKFPEVDELVELTPQTTVVVTEEDRPQLVKTTPNNAGTIVKLGYQVDNWIDRLPDVVRDWVKQYQQPLTLVGVAFLGLVVLQLISSVFSAVHEFPLLAPLLRVIGFIYLLWYGYQNFIFAESRRKTWAQVNKIKEKLFANPQPETEDVNAIQDSSTSTTIAVTPVMTLVDDSLENSFNLLFETIRAIRNLRAEAEIKPGVTVNVILQSQSEEQRAIMKKTKPYIQQLAKVENLTVLDRIEEDIPSAIASVVSTIQILIPLSGVVEVDALKAKLTKKLSKIEAEIKSLEGRLNNPNFVNKAPEQIIENTRHSLTESKTQANILQERLQLLK